MCWCAFLLSLLSYVWVDCIENNRRWWIRLCYVQGWYYCTYKPYFHTVHCYKLLFDTPSSVLPQILLYAIVSTVTLPPIQYKCKTLLKHRPTSSNEMSTNVTETAKKSHQMLCRVVLFQSLTEIPLIFIGLLLCFPLRVLRIKNRRKVLRSTLTAG